MRHIPTRRRDGGRPPAPAPRAGGVRALGDVDRWLTSLAEDLDAHIEQLTRVEDAFGTVRGLAREGGEDELRIRRSEHAFRDGVEQLASLSVALRRGSATVLGPRRD